jgi:uncharacterized protein YecE (DUF72 family)
MGRIGRLRIGTSGWVYKQWKGVVYPADLPMRRWLAHYAELFDTVEVNNSFYRMPSDAAFHLWGKQVPADFLFAVKASRYITHMKKLKDPEGPVELFLERARELGQHLGPILYQLPPVVMSTSTGSGTSSRSFRLTSLTSSSSATRPGTPMRCDRPSPNAASRSASTTCAAS